MHRGTRALLHCVALFSLLSHGNAAKGPAPAEVLTHFARAVGTILVPLPNIERAELQQRPQQQQPQPAQLEAQQVEEKQQEEKQNKTKIVAPIAATRRQVNSRQIPTQDADDGPVQQTPTLNGGLNTQQFPNQGDYPLQLGTAAYGNSNLQQLLGQSLLYQGAGGPFQGQFAGSDPRLLGLDPRLLQQLQGFNPYGLGQQGIPKPINPLGSNFNSINGNLKDTGSINSIQDADSKSGQNNRQYDPQDFQQGGGLGQQQTPQNIGGLNTVGVGGYRGYSGQLSYSPLNQQRQQYFNNFNDIGSFGNSGGSPFNQFQSAQLNYGGAGGSGVNGLGLGGNAGNGGGGGGESFFGNSQYQSQGGFNNFPGGAADGGQGFQGNFQSQFSQGFAGAGADAGGASGFFAGGAGGGPGGFAGGAPGGFGGVNGFAGAGGLGGGGGFGSGGQGGGGGFGSGGQGGGSEFSGSSLRATATKETAEATNESALDKQQQKVLNQRFLQAKRREFGDKTSRVSSRS